MSKKKRSSIQGERKVPPPPPRGESESPYTLERAAKAANSESFFLLPFHIFFSQQAFFGTVPFFQVFTVVAVLEKRHSARAGKEGKL